VSRAGAAADPALVGARDDVSTIIEAFRAKLRHPERPLSLLVRFEVGQADEGRVEAAFGAARSLTLSEPGCVAFTLNRDALVSRRFVVYEQWRSLADLEAHLRTGYVSRLRSEFNELIVGAPEFHVLLPTP
jgi:quinol monooxygenase YgiN